MWRCDQDRVVVATAGLLYTIDLFFNFHVGFIGKYNTQKTLVMDGRAIARYYVTKGTFIVDFITACCWTAQVGMPGHTVVRNWFFSFSVTSNMS